MKISHCTYSNELPKISSALRRLATAASGNLGSDCYMHSAIAQNILDRVGITSRLVVGYAAWRVGNGDSDIILHAPLPNVPMQTSGVAYHVWLELDMQLLDLTAYQLRHKAAQLDELDGGTTNVVWCPDYLFVPSRSVSPLQKVIQLRAGLYHYARVPHLEEKIITTAPGLDEEDIATAWLLYQNQELRVFGPNNMPTGDLNCE